MKDKLGMRIGESVFSAGYLLFALISSIIFFMHSSNKLFLLYGIMVLVLCLGDSFHLVPRIIKNIKGNNKKSNKKITLWMNLGLLVTSITMTIFYILLFYIWKMQFNRSIPVILDCFVWLLALLRIVLCLLPSNNWFTGGNKKMSFMRNYVFLNLGLLEVILFILLGGSYGITMVICILLSFAFYIPVTLYAKDNPKIGMLMIPKTIMYIIVISLGLGLI